MIQIPPSLPEPGAAPRKVEGVNVQAVPAVLADKPGVMPGVVLNLPAPVLETTSDALRTRDSTAKASATQIDGEISPTAVRVGLRPDVELDVRQGLTAANLPERLIKLLMQLEKIAAKPGAPVMWPQAEQLTASRPEVALLNLRRALGDSMLFEIKRLQKQLVPSASQPSPGGISNDLPAEVGASSSLGILAALTEDIAQSTEPETGLPPPSSPTAQKNQTPNADPEPAAYNAAALQKTQTENKPAAESKGEAATRQATSAIEQESDTQADSMAPSPPLVWARRGETLDTDSVPIRDAIRLLLHGELRWQGELSPGVFARLDREDIWEQDPRSPGALVKGTGLNIEMDLPNLGRVRVRAMFVNEAVRVTVLPAESARGKLAAQFEILRERLAARGLETAMVRLAEARDV